MDSLYKEIGLSQKTISEKEEITILTEYTDASLTRKKEIEDILVRSALKAAYEIGSKYAQIPNIDREDAIQEAIIGMLEAVKKYNINFMKNNKRIKFITFAYGIADMKVKDWIMKNSRLIRLPRSRLDKIFAILDAYKTITHHTSLEEIFKETNKLLISQNKKPLTFKQLSQSISLLMAPLSLQKRVGRGKHGEHHETLEDRVPSKEPNPEDLTLKKEIREKLLKVLESKLNELEYKIIFLRYFQDRVFTYSEVNKAIPEKEITQERIRQIEKKVLKKLQNDNNCMRELKELIKC